jgi:sterol desaturase/sphingolipid hydroxylase (fatty acid hydroxylase superfamily)
MTIQQLQQHFPPVLLDIVRLSIWLVLLIIIFIPLEKLWPQHKQKFFRPAFFIDLGYYFINSLLTARLVVTLMANIAWALHSIVPSEVQYWAAELPFGIRLMAALFVGEIGFYWGHRWAHEIPLLWRFHAIHHSAEQIDWLVNTRAHPIDMAFTRLCGFLPLYVLGFVQPLGNKVDLLPVIIALMGIIWGFFIHANLRWRFGWLEYLIATPCFHHWHHTNDGQEFINKNYAAMLPWVDKLFGTFYLPNKQWPTKYGIEGAMSRNWLGQLIQPFVYWKA